MKHKVIILGAGITGLTMGCLLAKHGINTAIIDRKPIKHQNNPFEQDGRAYAIAHGSATILTQAGIWPLVKEHIGNILDIRVSDNDSLAHLDYSYLLASKDPMGYMVPAQLLHNAAIDVSRALGHKPLHLYESSSYTSIEHSSDAIHVWLDNGVELTSELVIATDGKQSPARKMMQIKAIEHDYQQIAIVCTIDHTKEHQCLAQERFLKTGPFACLPLKNPYQSSLVWVEHSNVAPLYFSMDKALIEEHIQSRVGDYLGKISLVSPLHHYPLFLAHAKSYTAKRFALLGDAAHGIHPLAGQGLNLGLRDIEQFVDKLILQHQLGLDLGADTILKQYSQSRLFDSWSLTGITHGLNCFFASNAPPVTWVRRRGLNVVNHLKPLKAMFVKHAMGKNI